MYELPNITSSQINDPSKFIFDENKIGSYYKDKYLTIVVFSIKSSVSYLCITPKTSGKINKEKLKLYNLQGFQIRELL